MRRTEFDLCRIAACIAIVLGHASGDGFHIVPLWSASFWVLSLTSMIGRAALPQFFMMSGALLLARESMEPWGMLKTRTLRLVLLFLFWSTAYAALRALTGAFGSFYDFAYAVVWGHYHLWFLPAMALIYAFMPVVHAAMHGNRIDVRYLLFLFFFFGLFLTNLNLTPNTSLILYRFTLNLSLDYLPHLGYAVWGWWLAQREMPRKVRLIAPPVFVVTLLITTQANYWYSNYMTEAEGWLFNFFSLPNFVLCTAAFCFFLSLRGCSFPHAKTMARLADLTLGVYLLHPMILNVLKQLGLDIRQDYALWDTALLFLALVACTFPAVWLMRRIPGIKKLV